MSNMPPAVPPAPFHFGLLPLEKLNGQSLSIDVAN